MCLYNALLGAQPLMLLPPHPLILNMPSLCQYLRRSVGCARAAPVDADANADGGVAASSF